MAEFEETMNPSDDTSEFKMGSELDSSATKYQDDELDRIAGGGGVYMYFNFKCKVCGTEFEQGSWHNFTEPDFPEHCGQKMAKIGERAEYHGS